MVPLDNRSSNTYHKKNCVGILPSVIINNAFSKMKELCHARKVWQGQSFCAYKEGFCIELKADG